MKTSIGSVNPGKKVPSFLERLGQMLGATLSKPVTPATSVSNAHTSPSSVIGKIPGSAGAPTPRIPVRSTAGVGAAVSSTTASVAGKANARTGASVASVSARISSGAGAAVPGTSGKTSSKASTSSAKTANAAAQSVSAGTIDPLLTLNDTQREESALVDKLPSDFPIFQWESLSTRLQQKVMQKSGLSPQEQWQLLNASTPLEVLSLVNAAQKNAKSGLITTREANEITDRSLRYSVARLQLNSTDTSSLPPLQKRLLRGKLDEVFAQLQEETEVESNDGPKATPRPNNTPLPKPGPSVPVITPVPYPKNGKIAYVFYTNNPGAEFAKQAEYQKKELTKQGYKVNLICTNDVTAFSDAWNHMDPKTGAAVIISHSNGMSLIF